MSDEAIEQEIQAKGLTAPRVTPDHINALMTQLVFSTYVFPGTTTTVAIAQLDGFTVGMGQSACVSTANFDAEIGAKIAIDNAKDLAREKLWELEGYVLKRSLSGQMERIARVAHEVNRAYCAALGDTSQPAWEDAPAWQRESARMGVDLHTMGDFGPEASHISWMNQKLQEGWVWGPEKNPELKQHHCLVPFADLPREQQAKDFLFRGVVHALK